MGLRALGHPRPQTDPLLSCRPDGSSERTGFDDTRAASLWPLVQRDESPGV